MNISNFNFSSEGQAQIDLEMAEHENTVLKSKLAKISKEHEQACSKTVLLEKQVKPWKIFQNSKIQVSRHGGRTQFSDGELTSSVPDTYYRQKIKMLEDDLDEMKHKLEESRRAELEAQYGQESAWRFGEKRLKRMVRSFFKIQILGNFHDFYFV